VKNGPKNVEDTYKILEEQFMNDRKEIIHTHFGEIEDLVK
jgi:hypothetical protein